MSKHPADEPPGLYLRLYPPGWRATAISVTHLCDTDVPQGVTFESGKSSGSNVACPDCGLDQESAEDEDREVWAYEVDNEGFDIWTRATCNDCERVEIFRCTGGKRDKQPRNVALCVSGKHRDKIFRCWDGQRWRHTRRPGFARHELDRKHKESHSEWAGES